MLIPMPVGGGTFGPAARHGTSMGLSHGQICRLG